MFLNQLTNARVVVLAEIVQNQTRTWPPASKRVQCRCKIELVHVIMSYLYPLWAGCECISALYGVVAAIYTRRSGDKCELLYGWKVCPSLLPRPHPPAPRQTSWRDAKLVSIEKERNWTVHSCSDQRCWGLTDFTMRSQKSALFALEKNNRCRNKFLTGGRLE